MTPDLTFASLFNQQAKTQNVILSKGLYLGYTGEVPMDVPTLASYHVQQLVSEIGEVLHADKRWKNFRNEGFDRTNKVEEIADCFIVLMNIAMFSGVSAEEMEQAIADKIAKVYERVSDEPE